MKLFKDDDDGYTSWLRAHPVGYVVNTTRSPSGSYLKLHVASCPSISSDSFRGSTWTAGEYAKVCSERRQELEAWAEQQFGEELDPCGMCMK